jgi:hypothetical protein
MGQCELIARSGLFNLNYLMESKQARLVRIVIVTHAPNSQIGYHSMLDLIGISDSRCCTLAVLAASQALK